MEKGKFKPPVKVGQVITAKVEGIGKSNDRLVKKEGYVIFVKTDRQESREQLEREIGTEISVKITRTLPKLGFGELA